MADPVTLTTERMAKILQEVQMGIEPRKPDTPEEAQFREELAAELEQLPEGAVVDFPVDYEL